MDTESKSIRKERLEKRFLDHGLSEIRINRPFYLEFNPDEFATPPEIAKRIVILYSTFRIAHTINDMQERKRWLLQENLRKDLSETEKDEKDLCIEIKKWLIKENLWKDLSNTEKELFNGEIKEEEKLSEFSFNIEKVYMLAWTLNIVNDLPEATQAISQKQYENLIHNIPVLGQENLSEFLYNQQLRDKYEICDENLFNELISKYFRDLIAPYITSLDLNSIRERHFALNWVCRFRHIRNWEETDISA
jgi:hypothetical protein